MNPSVKIDTRFKEKMDKAAERWPFRMHKAMRWAARYAHSRASKRVSGDVLKVRTNWLRSSLGSFTRRKGDSLQAGIFTMAGYGKLHEWGLGVPKRPFLTPSVEEGVEKLIEQIEVWEE
jgi:hypothetical protein